MALTFVGLASQIVEANQKCYALVLGSGDENAAFQAGALQAIL